MDISIAQFKKHYVCVCVVIAFSLAGIMVGYKQLLATRVFPLVDIDSAYISSFILFFAVGVMLPQWLLKVVFMSKSRKSVRTDTPATLPSGRADLQPVTLVLSAVSLLLAVLIVIAVVWHNWFITFRSGIYARFLLADYFWLVDGVLVFLFSGYIWVLAGFLCAILYRMAISLTTQTGVYQTLEQRFYLLLFSGCILGEFFWSYYATAVNNVILVLLSGLLPLVLCAFWLPAVFSRSAERSYIKHFELKVGVQERSYVSVFYACLAVFLAAMLMSGFMPVVRHIEILAGFSLVCSPYHSGLVLACLYLGWYLAFRRDLAGRQYPPGSVIPLHRWSAACLGTVFVLALFNSQDWFGGIVAILLWYVFYGFSLVFLGELQYLVKQLMPRAMASLSLSWMMWVVMFFLGSLAGRVVCVHWLLPGFGSLMTVIVMFFASVIASGVVIVFVSPQERWHRRMFFLCILPILFSTLIIFWISHNWIIKKQDNVVATIETMAGSWQVRKYDNDVLWYNSIEGVLNTEKDSFENRWRAELLDILAADDVRTVLIYGAALDGMAFYRPELVKDIITDQSAFYASGIAQNNTSYTLGLRNVFWNFQQLFADKWLNYDLIWLEGPELFSNGIAQNLFFWHKITKLLNNRGRLILFSPGRADDREVVRISECLSILARPMNATLTVSPIPADNKNQLPEYTILTLQVGTADSSRNTIQD